VSPRTNRPRQGRRRSGPGGPATQDPESGAELGPGAYTGPEQSLDWRGEEWVVRRISGSASTKVYRCPGCDQEIRPATPHVVAWPAQAGRGLDDRRHWHTACWSARDRRGPR
jgi:hypothetical protein